ncbi:hypothetical protein HDC90_002037 [Pedobacter sp. AK013]|nr:hypothetical protein [Pedobacter sp. AK013]
MNVFDIKKQIGKIYQTTKQYFIAKTRKYTQHIENLKIFYTFA